MSDKLIRIPVSILLGLSATVTKQYVVVFISVFVGVVLDVVTGLVRAKALGQAITSKKSIRGFWKKLAYFFAVFAGVYIDMIITCYSSVMSFQLPFNSPVTMIIGSYICLTEAISICENIAAANSDVLPSWLVKLLKEKKDEVK